MLKWFFWKVPEQDKRLNPNLKLIFIFLLVILTIYLLITYSSSFNTRGLSLLNNHLKDLFSPLNQSSLFGNGTLVSLSFNLLWSTLAMITLGTFAGYLLSFMSAFFVSKVTTRSSTRSVIKVVLLFFRAIPILVLTSAFTRGFPSNWATFLVFTWFTWLWVHKYLFDIFETIDLQAYRHELMQGRRKFQAFYHGIVLRIWPRLFSLYLFSFESNFRWITLLQATGIFTLGELILYPINTVNYNELIIPLVIYSSVLIIIEIISFLFNKYFFMTHKRSLDANVEAQKIYKKRPLERAFFLSLFGFLTLSFMIVALTNLEGSFPQVASFFPNITRSLNLDLKNVFAPFNESLSPLSLIFEVLGQTILIFILSSFFGFIYGILQNEKVNPKWQSFSLKGLSVLLRAIPAVLIFILSSTLWFSLISVLVLALSFQITFSVAKHVSDQGNILEQEVIQNLKSQGYSYWRVVYVYYYPMIKKNFYDYLYFNFTNTFRAVIFYGVFGGSRLGNALLLNLQIDNFVTVGAYVWMIILTIMLIESSKDIINYLRLYQRKFFNFCSDFFSHLKNRKSEVILK